MARIQLENCWIEFPVKLTRRASGSVSAAGGLIDADRGVVTALREITAELRDGDRLGLIGHNGAGKSTMLRLLAGCYPPTRGRILVEGRIATLFNATPGLNIDGSGRENIIICALHLGLPRARISAMMDDIIEFAELGDYIDLPLRIYSAGMMTRLAFSIATAVEPEILLLDEGLATGDARFAQKAQQRMDALIRKSSILVIASHAEALVAKVCNRTILLEHGQVVADGGSESVLDNYRKAVIAAAHANDERALHKAFLLANDMVNRGEMPIAELEEQGLRYALKLQPNDVGMLRRYVAVLNTQGKPVPEHVEVRLLVAALQADSARDDLSARLEIILSDAGETLPDDVRSQAETVRKN